MATVMVGLGMTLLDGLSGQLPPGSVTVLEEPELLARRADRVRDGAAPVVARLVAAGLTADGHAGAPDRPGAAGDELVRLLPGDLAVDRVLPGTEAGVVPAARLAERLGLPGAGVKAAATLRNKAELRTVTGAAGIPGPRWRRVRDRDDLTGAARELGGPLVLKPLGQAGSRGVVLVEPGDDLDAAWARAAATGDTGYLVEERMTGPEVSVECLVSGGDIVFCNVTDKQVAPGAFPVEVGHVVPGPIGTAYAEPLRDVMRALAGATGFGDGILHAEWILTREGPALVECAGRIPGDRILELIGLAWDVPLAARYADVLAGEVPALPSAPVRGAAIRFLTPEPGRVRGVSGLAEARRAPGVREVVTDLGERVRPLRSSDDRVGYVLAVGTDAGQARDRAGAASAAVRIRTW